MLIDEHLLLRCAQPDKDNVWLCLGDLGEQLTQNLWITLEPQRGTGYAYNLETLVLRCQLVRGVLRGARLPAEEKDTQSTSRTSRAEVDNKIHSSDSLELLSC